MSLSQFSRWSQLFACVCMLNACGGSSNSTPSNASSSSSVASSSMAPMGVDEVFTDALNPAWGAFSVYEFLLYLNSYASYGEGQLGHYVRWQVVESADLAHKQVLDVNYLDTSYPGWAKVQVASPALQDLSSYATGTLSFDINVVNWGATFNRQFAVYVECGWPCSSHAYTFQVDSLNSWNHIEIPVAGLIESGLDIAAVDRPFVIFPMRYVHSFSEAALRFQLDNIKWTPGTTTAVPKNTIYAEHFNSRAGLGGWNFIPYQGSEAKSRAIIDRDGWVIHHSGFILAYDNWAMEVNLESAIDLSHKQISFKLQPHLGSMDSAVLRFVAIDGQGKEAAAEVLLSSLTTDTWNQLSFAVDTDVVAEAGFNFQDVRKLAIRFDANGDQYPMRDIYPYEDNPGTLRIDEILITE